MRCDKCGENPDSPFSKEDHLIRQMLDIQKGVFHCEQSLEHLHKAWSKIRFRNAKKDQEYEQLQRGLHSLLEELQGYQNKIFQDVKRKDDIYIV